MRSRLDSRIACWVVVSSSLVLAGTVSAQQNDSSVPNGQARFEQLANLPFSENRPTAETAQILGDELQFQRATQTYLWALPALNVLGMKYGSEQQFGAGYNVLPIWKKRLDAKALITTPNSDVIYAMSYLDLGKDGTMVFEVPPQMQGILDDFWQRPIPVDGGKYFGDIGFFGPDQGKGGKFLILPPGYKGKVPSGYYVYRSSTNNVFVFLRGFYTDPKDLSPPVKLMEQAKIYPLNNKAGAKPMVFPDASGIDVNMLPRSDFSAWEQMKAFIDSEPPSVASPDWLGMLASIGIIKGQPFNPDAKAKAMLDAAAKTGYKMSRVIAPMAYVSGRSFLVYPGRRWVNPVADATMDNIQGAFTPEMSWTRRDGGYIDLNTRIWYFTDYYALSPGMVSQTPGKGAKYGMAFVDSEGNPITGDNDYVIHLPANVPAENFWSITLYEMENASGLANGQPFPSLGSRDKPAMNADGSTDIYLGQKAPPGKEANWLATPSGRGYFVIFRLYGPSKVAILKQWVPGDVERVK
jgi:hypothetical protein